jgi:carbamoyl-phosphate synthase large subunit
MPKRVLVLEAGTGASEHLIRSLREGDDGFAILGGHWDQFFLRNSAADARWLVPPSHAAGYATALRRIVTREAVDVVLPNADESVAAVSAARRRLGRRVFLPRHDVIDLCQDKQRLATFLERRGIPVPRTHAVTGRRSIDAIFRRLRPRTALWCRLRSGCNSRGAAPVATPEQARGWIRYWCEMRGVRPTDFTLAEYLPGRDFACLMLWQNGSMVLAKTCERLSYFFAQSQPSGRSSMAGLSKTVYEPRVVETCARAIRALDPKATGAFSVDLKTDEHGEPRITEINAGRLIAQAILLDRAGKHSLSLTYARLALAEPVTLCEEYDAPEDYYFVRNVDAEPLVFHASEFSERIEDARAGRHATPGRGGRPRSKAPRSKRPSSDQGFEIVGALDRHAIEALYIDLRRLGGRMGFGVSAFNVS